MIADQQEQSRTLGAALLMRCDDCWTRCEERLDALGIADVGTAEFRARRRACQTLGVRLFARWLMTGEAATVEERSWLGELGELGAKTGVSISNMTRGYLIFRDVVWELIEEEAGGLAAAPELLGPIRRMNAMSCDSSILWMSRNFDAELVASEGRFRSVYESISCGVVVVAPDGIVTGCNDAAAAMLEFPADRLVGTSVFTVSAHYKDESGAALQQVPTAEAVAERKPIRGRVIKHDFGDGRPVRWHQVDAVPVFGRDGRLLQVVSTFVDVTAVKAADELRQESAAKNRFLATMSHELRTPLNSILGFAQLLRMQGAERLDDKQRRYLTNIEASGGHLLALINDILELSKAAAGQLALQIEDVEVAATIELVAAEFEPMLVGRPIRLVLDLGPDLVARIDPIRFRQVVVNLLANALKFTETGSVTISTLAADGNLELRVADSGIGIPWEQIERAFDEFTQVDSSSTRTRGGTGLGLPLTRRLIEMMGGTIRLESTVGSGTTAVVLLPLTPSPGRT